MIKVLMVSTEYPPMKGGVGRYTHNLVDALRNLDPAQHPSGDRIAGAGGSLDVKVVCSKDGRGDFDGLSPDNENNSDVLLRLVEHVYRPDVVHIQFEPGLYGLFLDNTQPKKSMTHIDSFYKRSQVPIVTTFHSAYTFREWVQQSALVKRSGKTGKFGIPARVAVRTWKCLLNYNAFHELNREKLRQSEAGISFSRYISEILGGGHVIYHGAEPSSTLLPAPPSKAEARKLFSLPQDKRIAVAIGFRTVTKGWDIIGKIKMPAGWVLVINSSKGHYNTERAVEFQKQQVTGASDQVIDLRRGFLTEEEMSTLLLASDAVLLPYRVASGSGVMFDALGHGLPFVSSDLEFFREFAAMKLGITVKGRDQEQYSKAIDRLGRSYGQYARRVQEFKEELRWENVARQHFELYEGAITEGREHKAERENENSIDNPSTKRWKKPWAPA